MNFKYNRPTNSYSHKGCIFRTKGKGCSFCSRVDKTYRQKSSNQVYEEYKYLSHVHKIDHISDFSDSWVCSSFIKSLLQEYEKYGAINSSIRVYGDVRLITNDNAKMMKELGVETVLLGIESGNEHILHMNGKPIRRSQILKTVHLLASNSIKVADAYVLGLIGETRESVSDTIGLAKEIRNICETEISYWNIMTPLPGSVVWGMLFDYTKMKDEYIYNLEMLERMVVDKLCHLGKGGYEFLVEKRKEMLRQSLIPSSEFVQANVIE